MFFFSMGEGLRLLYWSFRLVFGLFYCLVDVLSSIFDFYCELFFRF